MKKIFAILLISILSMAAALKADAAGFPEPQYNSENQTEWTIGFSKNKNGMARGIQGSNGWYCLYTLESNKGGVFNLSKMKAAKWGRKSNCWKYYGVTNNWSPDIYLQEGYDFSGNGNWWLMDGNGRMDTNVAKGVVSGAYAWAAPADGRYRVSVDYTAGGGNSTYDSGITYYAEDGVTLSINTKDGLLALADTPATTADNPQLSQGNLTKTAQLKGGELVYVIVDPQKSGGYDYAQLSIHIRVLGEDEPDDENGSGNGAGDGSGNGSGDGTGNTGNPPEGDNKQPEDENKKPEDENKKPENENKKPEENKQPKDEDKKPGQNKGNGTGSGSSGKNGNTGTLAGGPGGTGAKPDVPLPQASENVEENKKEDTKEKDSKDSTDGKKEEEEKKEKAVSELTGKLTEELDHAQEEPGQQEEAEEAARAQTQKAEEADAGGLGDTETEPAGKAQKMLLVFGLLEVLGGGILVSAGKFYFLIRA